MTRRTKSPSRRTPGQLSTAEQLPSGKWRAFYRREGRKFAAPRTYATRAEATAWLAAERADRARGTWRDPEAGRISVADYATAWLSDRADLAPRTRDIYARNLRRWILPRIGLIDGSRGIELGAMDVADITPAVLRTWRGAIIRHAHAHASAARQLAREREREEHPARAWTRRKGIPVAETGRISPAVVSAWRAAVGESGGSLFSLGREPCQRLHAHTDHGHPARDADDTSP